MRALFDLGHPAHFHLFRHAIAAMRAAGHDVEIIARQKDVLEELLAAQGWSYHLVRRGRGLAGIGKQSLAALAVALKLACKRRFDLMAGTSIVVAPAARLTRSVSFVFGEDDATAVPLFARLAYPLAHYVVTPHCLAHECHGDKHLTYRGYHELAYLHPRRFTPDPTVRRELGLADGERYFVVRLVALKAHHDIGERGISPAQVRELVDLLSSRGKVFVNCESPSPQYLPYRLPTAPARILDVLAGADMVVGDSQTMTAEAAVLGTPALRCNTFVGRLAYLGELENKYGLTEGFLPQDFPRLLLRAKEWLDTPGLKDTWRTRREAMLRDCVDVTDWMLATFGAKTC